MSVKVRNISDNMIDALYKKWDVPTVVKEGKVTNVSRVRQVMTKDELKVAKQVREHLEDLNWEVVVIDNPGINASCFMGGKIVVNSGFLERFTNDDEIALVIGHEIGHAVGRHGAEMCREKHNKYLKSMLKLSRRLEYEADYVGLLLMASAGYDPRVAPQFFRKLGNLLCEDEKNGKSTHPLTIKRAEFLSRENVMKEALYIYSEFLYMKQIFSDLERYLSIF